MDSGATVDGPMAHIGKANARLIMLPNFGMALRSLRHTNRLSMGEVVTAMHRRWASLAGFSIGQLSRYEAGRSKYPDMALVYRLAELYGGDIADLVRLLATDREYWAEKEMIESTTYRGGAPHGTSRAGLDSSTDAEETRVLQSLSRDLQPVAHPKNRRPRTAQTGRKRPHRKGA